MPLRAPSKDRLLARPSRAEESLVDSFAFDAADRRMPVTKITDRPNFISNQNNRLSGKLVASQYTPMDSSSDPRKNAPMSTRPGTPTLLRTELAATPPRGWVYHPFLPGKFFIYTL
jgi:hypothetical protein